MNLKDQFPNYTNFQKIAQESTTFVVRATDLRSHKQVAIKIPRFRSTQTNIEAQILPTLHHESIIELEEVIETANGKALVLTLAHNDLFNIILDRNGLTEDDVKVIMIRLFNALDYCHSNGVCHGDVKPENILVMSEDITNIRLADFGYAINSSGVGLDSKHPGTAQYRPPEMISGGRQTEKVDLWSAGVSLFVMISCSFPYSIITGRRAECCIIDDLKRLKASRCLDHVSEKCRDLFWKLVEFDPERRLSARQALQHEWFAPRLKQNLPGIARNPSELTERERESEFFDFPE